MTHGPMKPANILFVHGNNDLYGADAFLLEIVKRLDRSRFHPIVILPEDMRHINRLSVELEKNGIEYEFLRLGVMRRKYFNAVAIFPFAFQLLMAIVAIVRIIRRRNIVIVHSNTLTVLAGAFAASLTRTPHLWHVHEILVEPPAMRRLLHAIAPRFTSVILCVSNAVRDHIAADQPVFVHKLRVIYVGIDAERFADPAAGERVRQEFGIAPGVPLIGMVGKVCRWKGQLVFAAAAARILRQFPQAQFAAVGGVFDTERELMVQFRSEVERLGLTHAFQIHDFRPDIRGVMNAYDIFVLPSTQPDPCPTVVLEAMAAGKPVIATAHGGPLEQVVDGETGYLVRPNDSEDIAGAISKMLAKRDMLKSMGEAGRRRVMAHFHIKGFMAGLQSLYNELDCAAAEVGTEPKRVMEVHIRE